VAVRHRIGIDENGLGPRLGPLVVTGVLAELGPGGSDAAERRLRGGRATRLGDSKELVAHGDVALGEAWARALAEAGAIPGGGASVASLVGGLSLDPAEELQRPCPRGLEAQCWSEGADAFVAELPLLAAVRADLRALERSGIRVVAVRSIIVCTKRLDDALDAGRSRMVVDLHSMERLVLGLRAIAGCEVLAVCGKVGGLTKYPPAFGPLGGRPCTTLREERSQSAYAMPGVGELRFMQDADGNDRLVELASLVGKYLREVLMGRIVGYYRAHDPSLPTVSGYHDPRTLSFVEATRARRAELGVPQSCFERRKKS
jgi:ribonuclease HII